MCFMFLYYDHEINRFVKELNVHEWAITISRNKWKLCNHNKCKKMNNKWFQLMQASKLLFSPGEAVKDTLKYGAAVSSALHFWATNTRRLSTCHKTPYKLMVFLTDIRILSHSFPSALHWGPYYRKLVSLKWLQKVSKRRKSSASAKPCSLKNVSILKIILIKRKLIKKFGQQ